MRKLSFAAGVGAAALAVAVVATPAQAAPEGAIIAAGSANAVPGSYIVTLKDSATAARTASSSLAAKFGGQVDRVYTSLNGFSAKLSEKQAKRLAADPSVARVEQDQFVHVATTQTGATWGIDRIDQRNLPLSTTYNYTSTGTGVNAYVIDTGVRISHSEFGGTAVNGYDFVQNDAVAQDGNGHGTHVAGTIAGKTYGVAKKAKIVAVRVLDNNGSGTIAGVVAGVDWVTANRVRPAVANMSLGGLYSSSTNSAVKRMTDKGITVAVAAGNESMPACYASPASAASALTVAASTRSDARASFSNYGSCVDIFAPGQDITSTWYDGTTKTISGTSMASPHVAGVAALILENSPGASPSAVASAMRADAVTGKIKDVRSSPNRLVQVP